MKNRSTLNTLIIIITLVLFYVVANLYSESQNNNYLWQRIAKLEKKFRKLSNVNKTLVQNMKRINRAIIFNGNNVVIRGNLELKGSSLWCSAPRFHITGKQMWFAETRTGYAWPASGRIRSLWFGQFFRQ